MRGEGEQGFQIDGVKNISKTFPPKQLWNWAQLSKITILGFWKLANDVQKKLSCMLFEKDYWTSDKNPGHLWCSNPELLSFSLLPSPLCWGKLRNPAVLPLKGADLICGWMQKDPFSGAVLKTIVILIPVREGQHYFQRIVEANNRSGP